MLGARFGGHIQRNQVLKNVYHQLTKRFSAASATTGDPNSVGIDKNSHLLTKLCAKFVDETAIVHNVLLQAPELLKTDIAVWSTFVNALNRYGFSAADCFTIISKEPQVLDLPVGTVESILSQWNDCPLSNDFMKLLLINRPELLFLPSSVLEKRIVHLHNFVQKPKSLLILLLQCPNVLIEQWEYVENKINYLTNVMRVDKSEILRSCALSRTLEHIKVRHGLLEKCGLYVAPSKYEHKRIKNEKSAFRNPPLKRIIDNEDVSFARKICKISFEEYLVYKNMIEEGMDKSDGEYYSGSDSSTDSD